MKCFILPPHLVEKLAEEHPVQYRPVAVMDAGIRHVRSVLSHIPTPGDIRIFDAAGRWNARTIPASELMQETRLLKEWALHTVSALGFTDFPDAIVRYGRGYCNAFYDGKNLVFGEGDARIFGDFTASLDVFAHEHGHALVDQGPGLVYQGQSGALNEHLADVLGVCVRRAVQGEGSGWRIGADLFLDKVSALRDMENPGTAYDSRTLGRDPQPGHMDHLYTGPSDNGGVHVNSGIPNRAFVLFTQKVGVPAHDTPLEVWLAAMGRCSATTQFQQFAQLTFECAGALNQAVREAWAQVGITV